MAKESKYQTFTTKYDDLFEPVPFHSDGLVVEVDKEVQKAKKEWDIHNTKYKSTPTQFIYDSFTTTAWPTSSQLIVSEPQPADPCSFDAQEYKNQGIPDDANVYMHINDCCICGQTGGTHSGIPPFNHVYNGCKGFILNSPTGTMKTAEKTNIPPKEILDLVKDSVPEDWYRHKQGQGWVYKNAKVDKSATVYEGAVVYDNAIVLGATIVYENAKVFGNATVYNDCYIRGHARVGGNAVVGYGSHIGGYAKIFGTVENFCNISGKTYIRSGITVSAHTSLTTTPVVYRTQKAKGLKVLESSGFDVPKNKLYKIERLKTKKQLENLLGNFVRPCPITPRHGFVDSRSVATLDDAKKLIKETKAADKEAEFIVMSFIKASHSGIWTEGQLSVGTGNDGATSGRDSIIIPILGVPSAGKKKEWSTLLKDAGITQSPYIELLWTQETQQKYLGGGVFHNEDVYKTQFVQLRDGPKLPNTVNFIPNEVTVTNVVVAEGDLLKWESDVKNFKSGTVVYHPGGSLASHYAIHAYLNNIPILIDREPKIGETLKPDTIITKPDISKLRKGFQLGCTLSYNYYDAAYIMMAGCHSTSQWLGKSDLFLGIAMGCCYRLLVAASLGEFRRYKSHILHEDDVNVEGNREKVYEKVWNIILDESIKTRFASAMKSFDEDSWGGSIGGVNWYILSRWGALIYNSLIDGDEKTALEALNKGVNSVHNGGWTFNKFISQTEMTLTAQNPIYALLKVAPILYNAAKLNFTENQLPSKYEVKEIPDVDEYVQKNKAEKYKKANTPSKSNIKNTSKKCCSNDCCGNPDCIECHPVVEQMHKHCPYLGNEKDVVHIGKEAMIIGHYDGSKPYIFPVCEKHLDWYTNQPDIYKLYNPANSLSESDSDGCGCLEHNCSDCYPDGCGCDCTACHDDGCAECCQCGDHDCDKCYPNGCNCMHAECHDCKWEHCAGCNPDHDSDHCSSCYANFDGSCTNTKCEKCYPETETESK